MFGSRSKPEPPLMQDLTWHRLRKEAEQHPKVTAAGIASVLYIFDLHTNEVIGRVRGHGDVRLLKTVMELLQY